MASSEYHYLLLKLIDFSVSENAYWDPTTCISGWQVVAHNDEHVIIARAPTQAEARAEACRIAEALQQGE